MATKKSKHSLKKVAKQLLKFFGPTGKRWVNGTEDDGEGHYCLIGALAKLKYPQTLLDDVMPINGIDISCTRGDIEKDNYTSAPDYNDRDGWAPIKTFLRLLAKGVDTADVIIDYDGQASQIKVVPLKL